jgi:hypothetical protein
MHFMRYAALMVAVSALVAVVSAPSNAATLRPVAVDGGASPVIEAAVRCGPHAHYVRGHRNHSGHYVKGHCVRNHHH